MSEIKGRMLCKLGWGWLEIKGQMWLVPALFFCPANACRNDVTLGLALIKDNSIIILVSEWYQSGDYPMLVEIRPT